MFDDVSPDTDRRRAPSTVVRAVAQPLRVQKEALETLHNDAQRALGVYGRLLQGTICWKNTFVHQAAAQ